MTEPPPGRRGAWVADITWPEVEARIRTGAAAVLPIGAGAKEHGPHLPMNTDQSQAEWLADRLTYGLNVLVWPTVNYGFYPAFREYPGSCSLPQDLFSDLVIRIAEQIRGHGVKNVCLLNTGLSTIPALQQLTASRPGVSLVNVYQGDHCRAVSGRLLQQRHGGHADERETSMMLAIEPGRVRMEQAVCWDGAAMVPGPLRRSDSTHPNYSPSGVIGDATLAEARKGRLLLDAILTDVSEAVAELAT
jgi:creatinine amidohydrolase